MNARSWAMILLLALPGGGSFLFYRILAPIIPPLSVVTARFVFGLVAVSLLLFFVRIDWFATARRWRQLAIMVLMNGAIPFYIYAIVAVRVPAGLMAILNATTPLFALLITRVIAGEKITPARAAGFAFGFLGVAVLVAPKLLAGGMSAEITDALLCLLCAFLFASGATYAVQIKGLHPVAINFSQCLMCSILLLPATLAVDQPWTLPDPGLLGWFALLTIGMVSTGLATVGFFMLLPKIGASNALLINFLVPVYAILMGWAVLGETLSLAAFAGMALIALGLAAIDGRAFAWLRGRVAG